MMTSVEQKLQAASAICRDALNAQENVQENAQAYRDLRALPGAPRDAQGWFELLSQFDHHPGACSALKGMKAALPAQLTTAGVKVEQYAVLNALSIAATRILSAPVPDTIKCLYATFCTEVAARERQWENHFDMENDPERFVDMAQLATLRRFPAGALNFAYEKLGLLYVTLNVHPFALPGYLYQRLVAVPFTKPAMGPHINYGRKNSLILQQAEYERSLWLMAKTMEMNPNVEGVNGSSWFYSQIVGEVFPHLAWMRDVYANGGAYLVDTFPADPAGYGFAYNSRKRQILYQQGKFCPRETAFFWSRNNFLAWASRRPDLAPEGEAHVQPPQRQCIIHIRSPKPARHAKRNSTVTLWNKRKSVERIGRINYILLVFALPSLILSLVTFLVLGGWAAVLTFPIWLFLAFAFQYFVSQ